MRQSYFVVSKPHQTKGGIGKESPMTKSPRTSVLIENQRVEGGGLRFFGKILSWWICPVLDSSMKKNLYLILILLKIFHFLTDDISELKI